MSAERRILLSLSLLLVLLLAAPALADVVHLRTGEAVKGRPDRERSNEAYLAVEDYLSGAVRRFAWDAVDAADRRAIQTLWGWTSTAQQIVEGVRIVVKLDDGSTTEVRGVIEKETDTEYHVMSGGEILKISKARASEPDVERMDIRDVYTPEKLMEDLFETLRGEKIPVDDFDALDAKAHWRIAVHAEWVGALERAKKHYEACAADEEYLQRELAAQRQGRVEALLLNQAALETLKEAKFKLRMKLFARVREILDGFQEKHPDAGEDVLAKVEEFRSEFETRRTDFFRQRAKQEFTDIVEDLITAKVREKEIAITDITSWCRRELPEEAFQKLASKVFAKNDEVTPEEARDFWDGRPKRQWRRVTYGSGTFIVDPPKIKPPKRQRRSGGGGRGGGGGAGPRIEIPKPPTRDQWWEKAGNRDREQWTMAYFVENSELFELDDRDYRPCSMCHGVGLLSKTLQTGDVLSYLCTRCGGAQQDVIVKYR